MTRGSAERPGRDWTLAAIAAETGARLVGDGTIRIRRIAGIREAGDGDLTFLANPRYAGSLSATSASAVIVGEDAPDVPVARLVAKNPYLAFARALELLAPEGPPAPSGTHPSAVVAPDARIGDHVSIGPHCVVGARAAVGEGTVLVAGVHIDRDGEVGRNCWIDSNVVIREECILGDRVRIHAGAVIGSDGFGYVFDGKTHRKIPQVGRVVIEDDVEIGANSTVDRATLGATRIGRGVRIDNLVHIAHNVEIGEHALLCAQVGISGSAKIGHHAVLGGQAGFAGHIEVGAGARVAAQSGVTKSVAPGVTVSGYPAQLHTRAQKMYAALRRLPDALRRLSALEHERHAGPGHDTQEGGPGA